MKFYPSIFLIWVTTAIALPTAAQVIPDTTLPNNPVITPNGNLLQIDGGTTAGRNLFHSFQEFSIPTGGQAFFNNNADIQNIFSRVTGGKVSNIDGLIRANGGANLFLINPSGIIFGPNAQLNIGGSFVGSTASSIRFADGGEFSAVNPNAPPLLTINVPIGLQFGTNPGSIINQSQARSLIQLPVNPQIPLPTNVGLEVRPGQSLALLGGDVLLQGGNLTAFQGEINLGAVASPGVVNFAPTLTGFDYANIQNFGNIDLSGKASVNASGLGGGAIALRGGNITLRQGANLVANTFGNINGRGINIQARRFQLLGLREGAFVSTVTFGAGKGGSLNLNASENVELIGSGQFEYLDAVLSGQVRLSAIKNGLFTVSAGSGQSGELTITTGRLVLRDGAVAVTTVAGAGNGGNLTVNAPDNPADSIELYTSGLLTGTTGTGKSGKITIFTRQLIGRDGGIISAGTVGPGQGGNIEATVSDLVDMTGFVVTQSDLARQAGSGLFTVTFGRGWAGDVTLRTRRLILRDGAVVSAASLVPNGGRGGNVDAIVEESVEASGTTENGVFRSGLFVTTQGEDTGNLSLQTRRITLSNGARISASSVGTGAGGSLTVTADEFIALSGVSPNERDRTGIFAFSGEINPATGQVVGSGDSGDLTVETGNLIIRDLAEVSVSNRTRGEGGDLTIRANAIQLDNGGRIAADNQAGTQGNITLETGSLQLRRGSSISTNAGTATGGNIAIATNEANTQGGNITINADTLVALENSDISANAPKGRGGQVSINAQGIFGTQVRQQITPESDITATGETLAQGGTVQINTPEVNTAAGLVQLPENVTDVSSQIATGCAPRRSDRFAITGRGGLPPDPAQTLRGRAVWRDVRAVANSGSVGEGGMSREQVPNSQSEMVEATGWMVNDRGQIELVANSTERSLWQRPVNCEELSRNTDDVSR